MRKRNISRKFLVLLNLFVVLAACFSFAAQYFNHKYYWLVYFGLAGFYLFLLNLIFVIIWLFKRSKWIFLSLSYLLLSWNMNASLIQFNFTHDEEASGHRSLKILSTNVGLFGKQVKANKSKVLSLCKEYKPDIVCFQEFQSNPRGYNDINDALFSEIGYKAGYFERTLIHSKQIQSGICIYSKYPIVNKGFYQFDQKRSVNACIYTDLDLGSDTIRVFNIHLQSIRLNPYKYEYLGDLEVSNAEKAQGLKEIFTKLKMGVTKRTGQADFVAENIARSPYPVILAGDFNAPPSSYAYRKIADLLNDSFVEAGFGAGSTYAGPIPFNRIDCIMVSDDFKVLNHSVLNEKYSDHFPVLATVTF